MTLADRLRDSRLRDSSLARFGYRLLVLARHRSMARARPRAAARYAVRSRELSNFSYGLENLDELARTIADVFALDAEEVRSRFDELRGDAELRDALERRVAANPRRDRPRFGYRCGPYAIARLRRPRRVLELGVHDGVMAAALLRALERNAAEGHPGEYVGFDATGSAGWAVPPELLDEPRIIVGDVTQTLPAVLGERSPELVVQDIGADWPGLDRAHERLLDARSSELAVFSEVNENRALERICERVGGRYADFTESSDGHFWTGDVRGIALLPAPDPER